MPARQIQYTPSTEPPAFTPPTTAQMGWRPSYPDSIQPFSDRREYRTRGGGYRSLLDTHSHAVFVPEKWAIPGNSIAKFYGPENPHLFINRREYLARGGGYRAFLDTQSHAVFAVEQWTIPLGAGTEYPDRPQAFINRRDLLWRGGGYRAALAPALMSMDPKTPAATLPVFVAPNAPDDSLFGRNRASRWPVYPETEFGVEVAVPVESWEGVFPDFVPLIRPVRALLQSSMVEDLTQPTAPVVLVSVEYPDSTRRASALKAPSTFQVQAIEPLDRVLLASATYVDTTSRRSLQIADHLHHASGTSPEQWAVPPLSWAGAYPSTTRRISFTTPEQLAFVTGTSPESWAPPPLSWSPIVVDHIPTLRPQTRIEGFTYALQNLVIIVPALSWAGYAPTSTRRLSLAPANHPSSFRGEALEQFARTLLASVSYPDATRRLQLAASEIPSTFRGEAVEQFSRILLTTVQYPDTTRRRALDTAQLPFISSRPEALREFDRILLASATYPDTTRRSRLATASIPSLAKGEALEQFARKLLSSVCYPDTTSRRSLPAYEMMSTEASALEESLELIPLYVPGRFPETTRRLVLTPDLLRNYSFVARVFLLPPNIIVASQTVDEVIRSLTTGTLTPTWGIGGLLPQPVTSHTIISFNDSLWVFGGSDGNDFLQKVFRSTDFGMSWNEVGFNSLPYPTTSHMSCVFAGKMWLMGGFTAGGAVDTVYSTTDGLTWILEGHLPDTLYASGCVVFNGSMYIIAGVPAGGVYSRKVFTSVNGSVWTEVGTDSFPLQLAFMGAAVHASEVFIVGGLVNNTFCSQKVYKSSDMASWTEVGSDTLPYPVTTANNVISQGGYLWLMGGELDSAGSPIELDRVFRSLTGEVWSEVAALPTAVGYGAAVDSFGPLIVGGFNASYSVQNTSYRFIDGITGILDLLLNERKRSTTFEG